MRKTSQPEFAPPLHSDLDSGSKRRSIAKCRWIIFGFFDPDLLALETTSCAPQLQTINAFISVSAGLRHEIGLGVPSRQTYRTALLRGATQGKASLVKKDKCFDWKWDSSGQHKLAGNDSSVYSWVGLRPDLCGRVLLSFQNQRPTWTQNSFNIPSRDTEWLTSKDTEDEGRELVTTDGRIILVTDDVMDSGNQLRLRPMRKIRERFRSGKYRTLQCDEGGTVNGRWTNMESCFSLRVNMSTCIRQKITWCVHLSQTQTCELQDSLSHGRYSDNLWCKILLAKENQAFVRDSGHWYCVSTHSSCRSGVWTCF